MHPYFIKHISYISGYNHEAAIQHQERTRFSPSVHSPGRWRTMKKSRPKIPMAGSYLMPKSMCSWIPKPKLPFWEKLSRRSSYSRTWGGGSVRVVWTITLQQDLHTQFSLLFVQVIDTSYYLKIWWASTPVPSMRGRGHGPGSWLWHFNQRCFISLHALEFFQANSFNYQ